MPTLPMSVPGQIVLASVLAIAAFALLLPKPRFRSVAGGTAAALAALTVFALWLMQTFASPSQATIESVLFSFFSLGALGFGTVLVVQRNPARGAIAFAFVILSTCGLFLLLAAPFLMAATVIIYAGAIIVTFLFVLMLSHAGGPSDENDRTREPLLGSLAGFAFVGLTLFTLYKNAPQLEAKEPVAKSTIGAPVLPAPVVTAKEAKLLLEAADQVKTARDELASAGEWSDEAAMKWIDQLQAASARIEETTRAINTRIRDYRFDPQAKAVRDRAEALNKAQKKTFEKIESALLGRKQKPVDASGAASDLEQIRDEVRLLAGSGELPARNVANLGLLLYADHLLAVELAGTLLLVATIGAVAIASRKGATA